MTPNIKNALFNVGFLQITLTIMLPLLLELYLAKNKFNVFILKTIFIWHCKQNYFTVNTIHSFFEFLKFRNT